MSDDLIFAYGSQEAWNGKNNEEDNNVVSEALWN